MTDPFSRSRRKRAAFAAAAVVLSLAVVVLVELGLRVLGWGGYPPLVRGFDLLPSGRLMICDPRGARAYFPPASHHPGNYLQDHFRMPKPAGTLRVFLFGGSAIRGYPQPRHLTSASFLEAMLADVWPEATPEVINFGTTAVASFPVLDMLEQAVAYDPDAVVVYCGHNEFYGSYGTASSYRAGTRPWMLRLRHRVRGLALAQVVAGLTAGPPADAERQLMEAMVGDARIGPGDWRRCAAANNLRHHVGRMIDRCRRDDIPVLVCTLPGNERDLAPLGEDAAEDADGRELARLRAGLDAVTVNGQARPAEAEARVRALLADHPTLARAHFLLGRILHADGRLEEAHRHFVEARDLDTMPWRATSPAQAALRAAAEADGAALCDVEAAFRRESPGGSIGWELMDDHVHPSLRGQALVAETILRGLHECFAAAGRPTGDLARLRRWEAYARELGDNPLDRYAVSRWMEVLFRTRFMNRHNVETHKRLLVQTLDFEQAQPPAVREGLRAWDGHESITFAVARSLLGAGQYAEAMPLLRIAPRSVPLYSAWRLEYVYHELGCARQLAGSLTAEDQARARAELARGGFLLEHNICEPWAAQRAMGQLHLLLGEYSQAVDRFLAARPHLTGPERQANDRELVECYLQLGQPDAARRIGRRPVEAVGRVE